MSLLGDGVVAALGPRITSENPPHAHEKSLESAVNLDRLIGILGTGGIILALGTGVGRNGSLIKADEPE